MHKITIEYTNQEYRDLEVALGVLIKGGSKIKTIPDMIKLCASDNVGAASFIGHLSNNGNFTKEGVDE